MTFSHRHATRVFLFAAAITAAAPSLAFGQEDQPVRRREPVRRPIIDLEKQAEERRPGQVMPGDGVPDYVPPEPAPVEPAAEPEVEPAQQPVIELPEPASAPPVLQQAPSTTWTTVPAPVTVGSVSAVGRMAQWRSIGPGDEVGVWQSPAEGMASEPGAEIRTGLGAETTLTVGGWQITIDRLTKAAILGAENQEDGSRRIEIHLDRGQVLAVPGPGTVTPLVVITPETVIPVEAGVQAVSQDAFRGTRVR